MAIPSAMQNYKNLRVSERARQLIKETYGFTRSLPSDERFGLTAQMRRASLSIGLNIAEGCSRRSTRELLRFLEIAIGLANELDFATVVCEDLGFGSSTGRTELAVVINQMERELLALVKSLRTRMAAGTRR